MPFWIAEKIKFFVEGDLVRGQCPRCRHIVEKLLRRVADNPEFICPACRGQFDFWSNGTQDSIDLVMKERGLRRSGKP